MKFADPSNIQCAHCATLSKQRVAKLLALEARCPQCDASFSEIGVEMRRQLDEVGDYWVLAKTVIDLEFMNLEEKLGFENFEIEEEEFDQLKTLRDLIVMIEQRLIEQRLASRAEAASLAAKLVMAAISRDWPNWRAQHERSRDDAFNFDARPIDVVNPGRWNRHRILKVYS